MKQEFTQEIKNTITEMLQGVHTAIPGKIVKFYPDKCEAEILPYGKFKKPNGEFLDFPQLNHIPIYFPQGVGQTATIVYPIKPGDECLIISQEQTLDTWRNSGAESDNDLRFDLTNSIALVGLFSKPNQLVQRAHDNESIIIQREETFIELYDGKIEMLVKDNNIDKNAYHLLIDGKTSNATLDIKNIEKDIDTLNIKINGNEGKVNLKTKDVETRKEVLTFDFDGKDGKMKLETTHWKTNNKTLDIGFDGRWGTIDLITKNWDSVQRNQNNPETAYIKMDGHAKTINIQGYVTVLGSFNTVEKTIQDENYGDTNAR